MEGSRGRQPRCMPSCHQVPPSPTDIRVPVSHQGHGWLHFHTHTHRTHHIRTHTNNSYPSTTFPMPPHFPTPPPPTHTAHRTHQALPALPAPAEHSPRAGRRGGAVTPPTPTDLSPKQSSPQYPLPSFKAGVQQQQQQQAGPRLGGAAGAMSRPDPLHLSDDMPDMGSPALPLSTSE